MNRTQAKRVWAAARDRGCKPLSWRLYDTLLAAARVHGTHEATNGGAAYELARKGLAMIAYPYATITDAGRAVLATIANAAIGLSETCGACGKAIAAGRTHCSDACEDSDTLWRESQRG